MHVTLQLSVNGRPHRLAIDTRTLLVDLLREQLRLTGTHIGCTTGNCGAWSCFPTTATRNSRRTCST